MYVRLVGVKDNHIKIRDLPEGRLAIIVEGRDEGQVIHRYIDIVSFIGKIDGYIPCSGVNTRCRLLEVGEKVEVTGWSDG